MIIEKKEYIHHCSPKKLGQWRFKEVHVSLIKWRTLQWSTCCFVKNRLSAVESILARFKQRFARNSSFRLGLWLDPLQDNYESMRHAFQSRNVGLACIGDYSIALLLFAYLASILRFLLPRRTPNLFRYLSRFNMQQIWFGLDDPLPPRLSLGGPSSEFCSLCQWWLWEGSCDLVCAKDAQREVCWGLLDKPFSLSCGKGFSLNCVLLEA